MKILVINGPNLNMLGMREPDIYGRTTYPRLMELITGWAAEYGFEADLEQSNYEGKIIDLIQDACCNTYSGLIINAGAYTHYSYAIRDALAILKIPKIEVHISDINKREAFRSVSVISEVCTDHVIGKGIEGYKEAIEIIARSCKKN